jgi:hypothetical protein
MHLYNRACFSSYTILLTETELRLKLRPRRLVNIFTRKKFFMAMFAYEDDSHFEREDEIAILKRTCTRVSSFMPSVSNVEPRSTNSQGITTFDLPVNTYCESTCCTSRGSNAATDCLIVYNNFCWLLRILRCDIANRNYGAYCIS